MSNTFEYPASGSPESFKRGFGHDILARLRAIQEDVTAAGPQGLISLIQAIINEADFDCDLADILRKTEELCEAHVYEVVGEMFERFDGDDPRYHLWFKNPEGFYQLH